MDLATCGIMLPDSATVYTRAEGEDPPECLLPDGHGEDHLCRLPDGRYILWTSAAGCDCFDFQELSAIEAREYFNAELKQLK
jgi:hypothetical protein